MTDASLYEILGILETASDEEIRKAYRRKMRFVHPDRGGSEEAAKRINAAYEVLSDPAMRAQYDRQMGADRGQKVAGHATAAEKRTCPLCDEQIRSDNELLAHVIRHRAELEAARTTERRRTQRHEDQPNPATPEGETFGPARAEKAPVASYSTNESRRNYRVGSTLRFIPGAVLVGLLAAVLTLYLGAAEESHTSGDAASSSTTTASMPVEQTQNPMPATTAPSVEVQHPVTTLNEGDCVDLRPDLYGVNQEAIPCLDEHGAEIVGVVDNRRSCESVFEEYTGAQIHVTPFGLTATPATTIDGEAVEVCAAFWGYPHDVTVGSTGSIRTAEAIENWARLPCSRIIGQTDSKPFRLDRIMRVSCDEPHTFERIAIIGVPRGFDASIGHDREDSDAYPLCLEAFQRATGLKAESPDLQFIFRGPSLPEDWDRGETVVVCSVVSYDWVSGTSNDLIGSVWVG